MTLTNIIESLIFAAAKGVTYQNIKDSFSDEYTEKEIKDAIKNIKEKYSGDCGIILIEYNSTYQFQSNPQYSDLLADILRPIKERQLSLTVLQTLSIIAYRQPITRAEIEDLRGGISSDYPINVLIKAELIQVVGRKETIGRPALFGTTDNFLKRFQLESLDKLPDYDSLMESIKNSGKYNQNSENIYEIRNKELYNTDEFNAVSDIAASDNDSSFEELDDDVPDFLRDEDIVYVGSTDNETENN